MRFLRSNTAVIVTVGPFYDKTDGVTIETGLTITNERITLTADTDAGSAPTNILDNVTGATSGTSNDLNYITGNDAGMMQLELAAADVNRVGRMFLSITDAANHVPVFHEFFVLPQAIYDWLTGVIVPLPANVTQLLGTAWLTPVVAGTPDVNAKQVSGDAVAADTLELFAEAIDQATGQLDSGSLAAGTITAASLAADAITAAKVAADVSAEIADAVWDEDATAHQTQGTFGQAIGDPVADANTIFKAVVTDATGATVGVDVVAVKAETAAILDDTDDIGVAGAGLTALGDARLANLDATVSSRASAAALATVQADTDDLQTRIPAALVGGRIDANVGAISADATAADNLESEYDGTGFKSYLRRNTATAGGASTITLDAGANATDEYYTNLIIGIISGTGLGQGRVITAYVGATKVATVNTPWVTQPGADSVFVLLPFDAIPGASAPTAAQVADAVWDETVADHVSAGSTGERVERLDIITTGGAGGLTNARAVNLDNLDATVSSRASQASVDALPTAAGIADAVLDEDMTAHQTQGTLGQAIGDPVADANTLYKAVVTDAAGATVGVDVVAVKADTAAILTDTADMQPKIGTPVTDLSTDIAAIEAQTDDIGVAGAGLTALGDVRLANLDATVSSRATAAALAIVDDFVDDLESRLTAGRATALDNLDATITSRASQASVDALPTANAVRDAVFARAFSAAYDSLTFDQMIKLFSSVLLSKASGLAGTTATYRNPADTADVLVATVDADGNRSAVVRTP